MEDESLPRREVGSRGIQWDHHTDKDMEMRQVIVLTLVIVLLPMCAFCMSCLRAGRSRRFTRGG